MEGNQENTEDRVEQAPTGPVPTCQSIDWYCEGETRIVRVADVEIVIRFIGRRGRRGRIAIEAPAGAVFTTVEDAVSNVRFANDHEN